MLLATLDEAMGLLILSGLGIVAAVAVAAWLMRLALRSPHVPVKIAGSLVSVLLGGGGLAIGGLFFLFGLAVADCPPDAYECPF
jgi:hypothetical protein